MAYINGKPVTFDVLQYKGNTDYSPDKNYFFWTQDEYLEYVRTACQNKPYIF